MKNLYYLLISICVYLLMTNMSIAQISSEKKHVIRETNTDILYDFSNKKSKTYKLNKEKAIKIAKEKGWIIRKEFEGGLIEIQGINEIGRPIYYITYNDKAAISVSTNKVWEGGTAKLNLDGTGMIIGEWDGGAVLRTHQEFNNTGESRVSQIDGVTSTHYHATHVAGTLIAGGVVNKAKGMSYNAKLDAYDWNNDHAEMATAAANGLLISNHSYGFLTGWYWDGTVWEWVGNGNISTDEDYRFGFYGNYSEDVDNIAYNAPYYLIVKSAGNDRGDGVGESEHPIDGGVSGYDCIGYVGNAKNILTVGAVDDVIGGYSGNPGDVSLLSFSSFGPCDDGRIKPDICGNGKNLYSTYDGNDQDYNSISGTSMSTPNVAGSILLLQEHYKELYSSFMQSATLKALVLHTADECGDDEGPDYKFGWGLLNTASAANVISNNGCSSIIKEGNYDGSTFSFDVTVKGNEPLTVTIVWTDPAGNPVSAELDPTDIMLVNDLDLTVYDGVATTYFPYKLDGQNPSLAATNGDNDIDNVEKIYISNPIAGTYTINVNHEGILTNGNQNFSIIVSGIYNGCVQNFTAVKNGYSIIDLNWNLNDADNDVLLAWSPDNIFGTPDNGTIYNVGDIVTGGGTILSYGTSPQNYEHSGLRAGKTLYYKAFSRKDDNTYSNGKIIQETLDSGIPEDILFDKGYTHIDLTWKPNIENSKVLIAWSKDNIFGIPEEGYEYAIEESIVGGGNVLHFDNSDSYFNHLDLEHSTAYYYKFWSYIGNTYYSSGVELFSSTDVLGTSSIKGKPEVISGTTELYYVEKESDVKYKWTLPEGWKGESSNSSISIVVGSNPGEILVTPSINDINGKSSKLDVSVNSFMIKDLEEYGIKLFPNPSDGIFNLVFIKDYETVEFTVINSLGNTVYSRMFNNPNVQHIDLSNLASGIYVISFKINTELVRTKFILRKK